MQTRKGDALKISHGTMHGHVGNNEVTTEQYRNSKSKAH